MLEDNEVVPSREMMDADQIYVGVDASVTTLGTDRVAERKCEVVSAVRTEFRI